MKKILWLMLLVPLTLCPTGASGEELLGAGDTFPDFKAKDQHEISYQFSPGTQVVLIAFDMASAKRANKFLADQGADFLDDYTAVYPHRIVLADAVNLLQPFPHQDSRVTVFRLNDNAVIQSVSFWNPKQESLQDYLQ